MHTIILGLKNENVLKNGTGNKHEMEKRNGPKNTKQNMIDSINALDERFFFFFLTFVCLFLFIFAGKSAWMWDFVWKIILKRMDTLTHTWTYSNPLKQKALLRFLNCDRKKPWCWKKGKVYVWKPVLNKVFERVWEYECVWQFAYEFLPKKNIFKSIKENLILFSQQEKMTENI